ncbi:MAG: hypothetical protein JWO09_3863 [Bacteroidetes bacterium]|nr:hypothetical protein [Bacteroidota bacterium]
MKTEGEFRGVRIAVTIIAVLVYFFVSLAAFVIASSPHNVARPTGKISHIFFVAAELIIYYLAFALTKKTKTPLRIALIVVFALMFSLDCSWRMLTFSYHFIAVSLDLLPHFLLIDYIPLYILLFITWAAGKKEE